MSDFAPALARLAPDLPLGQPTSVAELDATIARLGAALEREPTRVELAIELAAALRSKGLLDEAMSLLDLALALDSKRAAAHLERGNVARARGDSMGALEAYARAAASAPDAIEPIGNRALVLKDLGQLDEAARVLDDAIARAPDNPELHYNLGNCRYAAGDLTGAMASFSAALARQPTHFNARINLGLVQRDLGHTDEALAEFDRAIALRPDQPVAHWNRALSLLLAGDYERGWPAYEWRWHATGMQPRMVDKPLWDGAKLEGRTILLHAEQGLGDTIQFARYAPMVAGAGGRVILEVQAPLKRLCEGLDGVETVIARGDELPRFDCHAPLMSLPALFGTTLDAIPNPVPYLSAPESGKRALAAALAGPSGIKRIGLVWGGNSARQGDAARSCRARDLLPLTTLRSVRLFSLQKGSPHAEQVNDLPGVIELGPVLDDMADTAFVISRLDLVVSVDTATAHLAGALGRPVWTMLAFAADWRYLLHRSDNLWYPTMKLFRQAKPGDWDGVVARVREALASGLL